jgi:hypothetical protein
MMGCRTVAAIVRRPNVPRGSAVGGGPRQRRNTGRMFINLKPAASAAMPKVVEGLRKKLRAVPGIQVYLRRCRTCSWAAARARAATSTRCSRCRPAS